MTDNKERILGPDTDTLDGYGVLAPELHPAYFPITYDDQDAVARLLRYTARIAYADQLGPIGVSLRDEAQHELERHMARLEVVSEGFAALMYASILDVVGPNDIVYRAARVKPPERAIQKLVDYDAAGLDHALKDIVAVTFVVGPGVSPDAVIAAVQKRHRVPAVYPGGRASLKVGRGAAKDSDPDYMVRNLTLAIHDDEGVVHLCELRVLDEDEHEIERKTRAGYLERQEQGTTATPARVAKFALQRFM